MCLCKGCAALGGLSIRNAWYRSDQYAIFAQIVFLDLAKDCKVLPHDPCLFEKVCPLAALPKAFH